MDLLQSSSRRTVHYDDDAVITLYDNMVEEVPWLEEAMGSDDGEDFNFDGNLDTQDCAVSLDLCLLNVILGLCSLLLV